jgi:uncharacterized protein (DUF433 family)
MTQLSLRDQPAYPMAEVAWYARVPAATLRTWVLGRAYGTTDGQRQSRPLIRPADLKRRLLSFNNLVEVHVLSALRTEHGTSVAAIRNAIGYAERELGIERLLLHKELLTDGQDLFLSHLYELVNLSKAGQLAMRSVLQQHLARVERDTRALPMRLFPFVRGVDAGEHRPIAIDPQIAFGRPVVASRAIATQVIAERIDAGETPAEIAEDYGISVEDVEAAVVYERAA